MDPLSITAATIGLAAQVLRVAVGVKNIVEELQEAPTFARDIAQNITVVHASLRELELAVSRNPQAIERYSLDDFFDVSVGSCRATLESINNEFSTLFEREDWKMRFTMWWNSGSIRHLLERLDSNKSTLMLLVQTLSLRSVGEMHELLQRNQATLDLARMGLGGTIPSYPPYRPREIDFAVSDIASTDGILGDCESVLSSSRFAFDEICIASKAYRNTVVKTMRDNRSAKPRKTLALLNGNRQNTSNESEPGLGETNVQAPVPATVPVEVHESVCLRLQEMETRNRLLEEKLIELEFEALLQPDRVPRTSGPTEAQDRSPRRPPTEEKGERPQEALTRKPSPITYIIGSDNPKSSPKNAKSSVRRPRAPKVSRTCLPSVPYNLSDNSNGTICTEASERLDNPRPLRGSKRLPGPWIESTQKEDDAAIDDTTDSLIRYFEGKIKSPKPHSEIASKELFCEIPAPRCDLGGRNLQGSRKFPISKATLEHVEEAIERLIMPELNALKKEQAAREASRRRPTENARRREKARWGSDDGMESSQEKGHLVSPIDTPPVPRRKKTEAPIVEGKEEIF